MIPMPPRNSIEEQIARAASKCFRYSCEQLFKSVPISEVAQVATGGTPDTKDLTLWDGEVTWVTPKDLGRSRSIEVRDSQRKITAEACERAATLLPAGTILLSSRAPIGHLAISGIPLCTNQGFKNIICSSRINNRYLFHLLRASIEDLDARGRGNTFKEIPGKAVKDFLIPLPPLDIQKAVSNFLDKVYLRLAGQAVELPELPPQLSKQRRVVAHIEEIATKIKEVKRLRSAAREETESLVAIELSSIFEQGKQDGWEQGRLGDYVLHDCYGTSEKTSDDETGTPILRMGNIQNGRLDLRDIKYLHLSEKERNKLILKKGDIIVNRTNSAELVGKCAVFNVEGEYGFASYLIRLRLDAKRAEPHLIAAYINSPAGRAYMFSERKQMTGQANVNATKLKALPIALPGLNEQREILAHLNNLKCKVDKLKQLQSDTAVELDALLPSVLDKAYKGEL